MNEHQPTDDPDHDRESIMTPASPCGEAARQAAAEPDEPDFSRLRMALATLDAAFPAGSSGGA